MNKRILFRVDAGDKVGLGHFYRSVNLAQYLKDSGHDVEFVHRPSAFWNSITGLDFPHTPLTPEAEEENLFEIIAKGEFNIFYVDGMIEFSDAFIKRVKENAKVVFYQNLTSAKALADIFILPSIHQDQDFFAGFSDACTIYKGLEYFTFNKEIERFPAKGIQESQPVNSIAVIAGGSDPRNILLTIHELLARALPDRLNVTFYYGQNYMHMSDLPAETPQLRFRPYDIADILDNDILIAAFGVSTYEFMHLGMPIISVAHQESNHHASKTIAEQKGAIIDLGMIDTLTAAQLIETIQMLINSSGIRKELAENGRKAVDLKGISRIAKIIENA